MYDNIATSLRKNWLEKLLLFLIASCLIVVSVLFGIFQAQTVPNSNALIPKRCDYNRDRYFTAIQSSHAGLSILSQSNISLEIEYPFFTKPAYSLWIRDRKQIWTLDIQNGLIYISQTINSKVIGLISLFIANCNGPYNWAYNQQAYVNPITQKLSGQVWVACSSSNKTIIIETDTYSVIGNIYTPPDIINSYYPSAVAVGPKYGFVVYNPNIWYAYSTQPPFLVVKSGQTPGTSTSTMTLVWRGNDNDNNADLYMATDTPSIARIGWNPTFNVEKVDLLPYNPIDITTSLNEEYLYIIFQTNNLLYVYETYGMTKVTTSGPSSVVLSKPNSIAIGRESAEMIVTDFTSFNTVLLALNPDNGLLTNTPPIFIYSGNETSDSIRFVQECPCNFC